MRPVGLEFRGYWLGSCENIKGLRSLLSSRWHDFYFMRIISTYANHHPMEEIVYETSRVWVQGVLIGQLQKYWDLRSLPLVEMTWLCFMRITSTYANHHPMEEIVYETSRVRIQGYWLGSCGSIKGLRSLPLVEMTWLYENDFTIYKLSFQTA